MSTLKFAFFRPFLRFLRWKGRTAHHMRKKPPQRRTDGQIRPLRRRARPLCARWLARLPVRSALRRSGRGAGEFVPRPSGSCTRRSCPRPAPPCSSLPSASDALLMRLYELSCADGREGTACSCVLVPPGLRRRRPPRRRFAVRWRGRAVSGARGGGQLLPRPLAASPSSVWSAWPLAALSRASSRRAGAWPLRPSGAAAARLRPLASAVSRRLVLRRPPWRVLVAAPAVFFSPLTTPLFSPWRWRAAMRKISVRGAKNSCAPARLKTGGLVACIARALAAFAATVRKRLASRPPAVRAPLAAPCAPSRAFARRSPPSSGGQARVVKGVQSSSVSIGGRARASGAQIAAVGGD